jgi:hypothetical protein
MSKIPPKSNKGIGTDVPPNKGAGVGIGTGIGNGMTKKKWDDDLKERPTFKVALEIFSSRKSPNVVELRKTLASFIKEPPSDFFGSNKSTQAMAFATLVKEISKHTSNSNRDKTWNLNYVATRLSLILVLHEMEMEDQAVANQKNLPRENPQSNSPLKELYASFKNQ